MSELLPLQIRAFSVHQASEPVAEPPVIPPRFVRGAMPRPPADTNVVLAMTTDASAALRIMLLAVLLVVNGVVVRELLVVPDHFPKDQPMTWRRLRRHVADLRAPTAPGCDKRVELLSVTEFSTTVLRRHVYRGKRPLVGADLAFVLVRLAEHVALAHRGLWRGGWTLGMPGWGAYRSIESAKGVVPDWRPTLHCPYLRVKALGPEGAFIGFSSCGTRTLPDGTSEPLGTWERTEDGSLRPNRGRFHDVLTLSETFGAPRDLSGACRAFDVDFAPVRYVPPTLDAAMVAAVRSEALAVHGLHRALIAEGESWGVP